MKTYWYQKQLRILQTVLRAPDLAGYDAERVAGYLEKTDSNCIVVNAGGVMDFFPDEQPFGRKNPFLTTENMLEDLILECHKRKIHVIARVDFRGVEKERYRLHPDWFALDERGEPQIGWEGRIYKPCYNSYYANEYAADYIRRLLTRYALDGIWENSVGFGSGPCYCRRCRERYREETGKEIPFGIRYEELGFAEYRRHKARWADEHLARMRSTVKEFGEEKAFCAEIFGMFHSQSAIQTGIDLYNAKEHFDFLVTPAFLDGSADPAQKWDELRGSVSAVRFLKSIAPEKQAVVLCGNNGTKWRYVKSPTLETRLWMWEAASEAGGIWNCYFNGQYPEAAIDRRNACLEQPVYRYLKENEAFLDGQLPVEDVGVWYSRASRDLLGRDGEQDDGYGVYVKGVEKVLEECHISYQYIPDLEVTPERIRHLKVLILPNAACLSDEQMETIRQYVWEGGGLVASYKTSLYQEDGRPGENFGLCDLFGCDYTGIEKITGTDSYQMIQTYHPILEGMEATRTDMLMNEGRTLLCTMRGSREHQMVTSYVPCIYNQPPELAYEPDNHTDYPVITAGTFGKGRVVYFANETDRLCRSNGHEDFIKSYENALRFAAREPYLMETDAPGTVHTHLLHRGSGEYLLSLVNATAGTPRPMRQIIPIPEITCTIDGGGQGLDSWKVLSGELIEVCERKEDGKNRIEVRFRQLQEFASVYLKLTGE